MTRTKKPQRKATKAWLSSQPKAPAGVIVRVSLDAGWRTPERILDAARRYFDGPIPFDAATSPSNPTNATAFCVEAHPLFTRQNAPLEERSGLDVDWNIWGSQGVWCNPPYGKALRLWIAKLSHEATRGVQILALLPVNRTETSYMQGLLECRPHVCFVRKRVAFISTIDGAAVGGNPYASWILGFNVRPVAFELAFESLGLCLRLGPS